MLSSSNDQMTAVTVNHMKSFALQTHFVIFVDKCYFFLYKSSWLPVINSRKSKCVYLYVPRSIDPFYGVYSNLLYKKGQDFLNIQYFRYI